MNCRLEIVLVSYCIHCKKYNLFLNEIIIMQENDDKKSALKEGPSPRMGIRPIWRARCITPYNPELLPPEAMSLREEVIKIIITIVTYIQ